MKTKKKEEKLICTGAKLYSCINAHLRYIFFRFWFSLVWFCFNNPQHIKLLWLDAWFFCCYYYFASPLSFWSLVHAQKLSDRMCRNARTKVAHFIVLWTRLTTQTQFKLTDFSSFHLRIVLSRFFFGLSNHSISNDWRNINALFCGLNDVRWIVEEKNTSYLFDSSNAVNENRSSQLDLIVRIRRTVCGKIWFSKGWQ